MVSLPCVYLGRPLGHATSGEPLRQCQRGRGPVGAGDCAACGEYRPPYRADGSGRPPLDLSRLNDRGGCCGG